MKKRSSLAEQCMVRMLCALALLLVGFAHQPPEFARADFARGMSPAEIAQYTLPDGTLPVLCHETEHGADKHQSHDDYTGCEVCRLVAAMLVPTPADTIGAPIRRVAERLAPAPDEPGQRRLLVPNTSPRGPPSDPVA